MTFWQFCFAYLSLYLAAGVVAEGYVTEAEYEAWDRRTVEEWKKNKWDAGGLPPRNHRRGMMYLKAVCEWPAAPWEAPQKKL